MSLELPRKFFEILLLNEGGYVNDKNDAGGETKFGISKRAYPAVDIKNMSLDDAYIIYNRDYWRPISVKLGDVCSDKLMFVLFDFSVNSGTKAAFRGLQRAVGITGKDADGLVGNITRTAMSKFTEREIIVAVLDQRRELIRSLVVMGKLHPSFERGIQARIDRCAREVL